MILKVLIEMQHDFLIQKKDTKPNFIKLLVTLLICAFVLIFSSNITALIYVYSSGNSTFSSADLVQYYGKNGFFLLQLIPFLFTLIALYLCLKFIYKTPFLSIITSRPRFDFKRFFLSFGIWFIVMSSIFCIAYLIDSSLFEWNFNPSFFPLVIITLIFVSIQTTFEEVFFRGFLLQQFYYSTKNKLISVILSSILFGLMHYSNPEVQLLGNIILIYFIGTGIFLALMVIFDNGLELSLGFHTANNIFASLILTNNWQVFQTDALFIDLSKPVISWEIWINLIVIFPILIFIYGKIYKWDNFYLRR